MSEIVTVGSYSDVLGHDEISAKDALAVVDALNESSEGELVIWVQEWLVAEKSLEAFGASDQVYVGVVDDESEKAWQLVQDGTSDWLPKSQATAFERAPDAVLTTPQNRLDEWGESA